MQTRRRAGTRSLAWTSAVSSAVLLLLVGAAFLLGQQRADRGLRTAFESQARRGQLVAEMRVALRASADAQKAAVMADAEDGAERFAGEARRAAETLETARRELGDLIGAAGRAEEREPFDAFEACWERQRRLTDTILGLAVQNTNLEAQRLSFVPVAESLDRMQAALEAAAASSGETTSAAAAAWRALAAALRIQVLESRHIAEPRDEEMDAIEARMQQLDAQVLEALAALGRAAGQGGAAALAEARTAYADFQRLHAEVLALSRENSGVRSFAMSLDRAWKTTAECEALLRALQRAVSSRTFEATR